MAWESLRLLIMSYRCKSPGGRSGGFLKNFREDSSILCMGLLYLVWRVWGVVGLEESFQFQMGVTWEFWKITVDFKNCPEIVCFSDVGFGYSSRHHHCHSCIWCLGVGTPHICLQGSLKELCLRSVCSLAALPLAFSSPLFPQWSPLHYVGFSVSVTSWILFFLRAYKTQFPSLPECSSPHSLFG